jgi:hypothetical protein
MLLYAEAVPLHERLPAGGAEWQKTHLKLSVPR